MNNFSRGMYVEGADQVQVEEEEQDAVLVYSDDEEAKYHYEGKDHLVNDPEEGENQEGIGTDRQVDESLRNLQESLNYLKQGVLGNGLGPGPRRSKEKKSKQSSQNKIELKLEEKKLQQQSQQSSVNRIQSPKGKTALLQTQNTPNTTVHNPIQEKPNSNTAFKTATHQTILVPTKFINLDAVKLKRDSNGNNHISGSGASSYRSQQNRQYSQPPILQGFQSKISTNLNTHYGLNSERQHHAGTLIPRKGFDFPQNNANRPPNPQHYSSRSVQTSKHSYHSLTSRSHLERHQIKNILKAGDTRQNCQLTLMSALLKRNRNKSRIFNSYGKNMRFFVLDFQCQKFYYKENMQIQGVYNFIVSRLPEGSQTDRSDPQKYARQFGEIPYNDKNIVRETFESNNADSEMNKYQSSHRLDQLTEKELELERQRKWNYGLEIYFAQKENKDHQELFVIYFNTKKQQEMWIDRFDRIIASNKSQIALRLNRSQRSIEDNTSNRSKYGQTLNMNSTANQMMPVVPLGVDLVSQDTMTANQLKNMKLTNGTFQQPKKNATKMMLTTQFEIVDARNESRIQNIASNIKMRHHHNRMNNMNGTVQVRQPERSRLDSRQNSVPINDSQDLNLRIQIINDKQESRHSPQKLTKQDTDSGTQTQKFMKVKSQFNSNAAMILKVEDTSVHDSFTGMSDDDSKGLQGTKSGKSSRAQSRNNREKSQQTPISSRRPGLVINTSESAQEHGNINRATDDKSEDISTHSRDLVLNSQTTNQRRLNQLNTITLRNQQGALSSPLATDDGGPIRASDLQGNQQENGQNDVNNQYSDFKVYSTQNINNIDQLNQITYQIKEYQSAFQEGSSRSVNQLQDPQTNNDLKRLEQLQMHQMNIMREIEIIKRRFTEKSKNQPNNQQTISNAEEDIQNEQETLDLENMLHHSTWKGSGLDSSKNSRGNYVSLNRNFRGHFTTAEISDNMFHIQKIPPITSMGPQGSGTNQNPITPIVPIQQLQDNQPLYNYHQSDFEILEEVENEQIMTSQNLSGLQESIMKRKDLPPSKIKQSTSNIKMKQSKQQKEDKKEEESFIDSGNKANTQMLVHLTTPDESQYGPRRDTNRFTMIQRNDNSSVSQFFHQNALSIALSQGDQQKLSIPKQISASQLSPIQKQNESEDHNLGSNDNDLFKSQIDQKNQSQRDDEQMIDQNVTINTQLGEQKATGQPQSRLKFMNQRRKTTHQKIITKPSNNPFDIANSPSLNKNNLSRLSRPVALTPNQLASDVSSFQNADLAPQSQELQEQYNQYMMMFEFNQKLGQNTSAFVNQQPSMNDKSGEILTNSNNYLKYNNYAINDNYDKQLARPSGLSPNTSHRSSSNLRKTKNSEVNFGSMKDRSLFSYANNNIFNRATEPQNFDNFQAGIRIQTTEGASVGDLEPSASVFTSEDKPPSKPPLVPKPGDLVGKEEPISSFSAAKTTTKRRRSFRGRKSPQQSSSRQSDSKDIEIVRQINVPPLVINRVAQGNQVNRVAPYTKGPNPNADNMTSSGLSNDDSDSQSVSPMTPLSLSPRSGKRSKQKRVQGAAITKPTAQPTLFNRHKKDSVQNIKETGALVNESKSTDRRAKPNLIISTDNLEVDIAKNIES